MALKVKLLEESFQEVAPRGEEFVAAFYERLFMLYPEVKPLFERTGSRLPTLPRVQRSHAAEPDPPWARNPRGADRT